MDTDGWMDGWMRRRWVARGRREVVQRVGGGVGFVYLSPWVEHYSGRFRVSLLKLAQGGEGRTSFLGGRRAKRREKGWASTDVSNGGFLPTPLM